MTTYTSKKYKIFFILIATKTTKRQIKTVSKENSSADRERQRSCKIIAQRWQKRVSTCINLSNVIYELYIILMSILISVNFKKKTVYYCNNFFAAKPSSF